MEVINSLISNSIAQWLPGLSSMPNLHPLFVHFPIALLGAFLLAQLLACLVNRQNPKIAADWLLYLGTLGAVAAAFAGLIASQTASHEGAVHTMMTEHRNMGLNAAALALLLSLLRLISGRELTRFGHISHLLLGSWIFFYIIRGADLGGTMVYQHGIGVQPVRIAHVEQQASSGHSHAGQHSHGSHNAHGGSRHEGINKQLAEWMNGLFKKKMTIRPHTH